MKNLDLLTENERPVGFSYPRQFTRVVELGLTDLEPWYLLEGKLLREALAGLAARYPDRKLVPFARRQDNDDVACWQVGVNEEVFVIHDFASPGWEQRGQFSDFYHWLRRAIEDLIEFDG
jgi:hypothetical protein